MNQITSTTKLLLISKKLKILRLIFNNKYIIYTDVSIISKVLIYIISNFILFRGLGGYNSKHSN